MRLKGKNIILGISGSIAAYKSVDLASQLKKEGANVHVVCTDSALKFVSALSLATMTGNKVHNLQFEEDTQAIDHIELADQADLLLIAPATANLIGKLANGISDNLLLDLSLVTRAPVLIAPAMNTKMWEHAKVRKNLESLGNDLNYQVIQPESGELACGYVGEGRLPELGTIVDRAVEVLDQGQVEQKLQGKKVIVTAGGTRESIDPARFISNRSSGKMGMAIADAAHEMGAEVVLVTTVPVEKPYKIIGVETAIEMQTVLNKEFTDADALVMAAAVADYRVDNFSPEKIKKNSEGEMVFKLKENPDVIASMAKKKQVHQALVGFALESELLESEEMFLNAMAKLQNKKLDFVVANNMNAFSSDNNDVLILDKSIKDYKDFKAKLSTLRHKASKKSIAKEICNKLQVSLMANNLKILHN